MACQKLPTSIFAVAESELDQRRSDFWNDSERIQSFSSPKWEGPFQAMLPSAGAAPNQWTLCPSFGLSELIEELKKICIANGAPGFTIRADGGSKNQVLTTKGPLRYSLQLPNKNHSRPYTYSEVSKNVKAKGECSGQHICYIIDY